LTLKIVAARGSSFELGHAYGEQAAQEIARSISFYMGWAEKNGEDWAEMAPRTAPFLAAARSAFPSLTDELDGLAAGAGVSLEDLAVLTCFEEVWPEHLNACVSFVAGRYFMHAEMWVAGHDDVSVIVAEPDEGPAFVSPSCAGFLPAVGLSSAGFAQGIDSLTAADDRAGIPRLIVSCASLGAESLDDAVNAALVQNRAGGYAHLLATAGRRLAVETSATTSAQINDCAAHTNHYLEASPPGIHENPGSHVLLERARWLIANKAPKDLEDCARLLADHGSKPSICLHSETERGDGTVFGMACDLVTGDVLVSDGRPCESRWHPVTVPAYKPVEMPRVG
jgi:isopenicillin-N N-acyltransferase like protein